MVQIQVTPLRPGVVALGAHLDHGSRTFDALDTDADTRAAIQALVDAGDVAAWWNGQPMAKAVRQ